ncbi:MAG TPA: type IV toxin-antitoxin system AbiEi family antitoxin domain-containing protein, partial [Mycobacteriales bacterium]|nr:type IV toxin-antitoxin system AbiEi family antitoxin domain-containing protein [Mycobacteriales bacterium]
MTIAPTRGSAHATPVALLTPSAAKRVRELDRRQHGVATREQVEAAGLTTSGLDAQLDAGRWRRVNAHVVLLHNGPLTRRAQMWAVLLSAQGPAALCSLTVLEVFG